MTMDTGGESLNVKNLVNPTFPAGIYLSVRSKRVYFPPGTSLTRTYSQFWNFGGTCRIELRSDPDLAGRLLYAPSTGTVVDAKTFTDLSTPPWIIKDKATSLSNFFAVEMATNNETATLLTGQYVTMGVSVSGVPDSGDFHNVAMELSQTGPGTPLALNGIRLSYYRPQKNYMMFDNILDIPNESLTNGRIVPASFYTTFKKTTTWKVDQCFLNILIQSYSYESA
jgi:hypothetical protein